MATPLEAEISSLMSHLGDLDLVADELVRRWDRNLLDENEQIDCAQFLVSAGLYSRLFEQVLRLLASGHTLPWTQFAEALGRARVKLSNKDVRTLFEGAEEQDQIDAFVRSQQLDIWDRRFAERRAQAQGKRALAIAQKKQALKDRLEFMRNNRMYDEERKVLEEIQVLFPDEPEFKSDRNSFELRWAREVIAKSSTSVTDPTQDLAWKIEKLTPEQQSSKSLIVARAKELAHENPRLAYDLAVCLHFMDFNSEAIDVLAEAERSPSADWLRLELMIRARQYVNALDEASKLEVDYADDPEAVFAVVYARARALWGLGQNLMAIDLLRSLVRIRPQYKSAHSLLMDWTGGDI